MPRDPAVLFVAALSLAAGYGLGEWPGFWLVCAALCLVALAAVAVVRGSVPDEPPLYVREGLCLDEADETHPDGAPRTIARGRCVSCGSPYISFRSLGHILPTPEQVAALQRDAEREQAHLREIAKTRRAARGL